MERIFFIMASLIYDNRQRNTDCKARLKIEKNNYPDPDKYQENKKT